MVEKELTQEELEKAAGGLRTLQTSEELQPASASPQGADRKGPKVKSLE